MGCFVSLKKERVLAAQNVVIYCCCYSFDQKYDENVKLLALVYSLGCRWAQLMQPHMSRILSSIGVMIREEFTTLRNSCLQESNRKEH